MAFQVEINVEKKFWTSASVDGVYALLADVPRSASHFPKVERFVDLGGNAYRWEMEKIGIGGHTLHETIYVCIQLIPPATPFSGLQLQGWATALLRVAGA